MCWQSRNFFSTFLSLSFFSIYEIVEYFQRGFYLEAKSETRQMIGVQSVRNFFFTHAQQMTLSNFKKAFLRCRCVSMANDATASFAAMINDDVCLGTDAMVASLIPVGRRGVEGVSLNAR